MRVDANVVIRHIADDHPDHAPRAHRLFDAIRAGSVWVTIEDVTLAEIVWTLSSYYRMDRGNIADALLELMQPDGIISQNKAEAQLALVLFRQHNLDFADALLAAKALAGGDKEIASFDHDFDRIPGVIRREPA